MSIAGTGAADRVEVKLSGDRVQVKVQSEGQERETFEFDAADAESLYFDGNQGDNVFHLQERTLPAAVGCSDGRFH